MAELKTKRTRKSVEKYLKGIAPEWKSEQSFELDKIIQEETGLKPAIWGDSIIGYGSYYYEHERSNQKGNWPLVGFSPRKAAFSVYIMPGFDSFWELLEKLGKHKTSVGCLYIRRLEDIDKNILREIIRLSVEIMRERYEVTSE